MNALATLVGQYNLSAVTLADGQYGHIALDSSSRVILDHTTSSTKIGDGTNILDILVEDTAYAGSEKGIGAIAVRNDSGGSLVSNDLDFTFLQTDANGRLRVDAEISVDTGADKEEDSAHANEDIGSYILGVRADSRPTNANTDADGDYCSIFVNANGEQYVHDTDVLTKLTEIDTVLDNLYAELQSITHAEDSAHSSGDMGVMMLAVRNDSGGSLVDTDGDYGAPQLDSEGRLRVTGEFDASPGTEADEGSDESGDGEITGVDDTWNDIVTIAVGAGDTLYICEVDGTSDKLCEFQLIVDDDGTPTKYIRKFMTPENTATTSLNFGRAIEVAGGTNISVKLQAKRLRGGAANATVSGGINAYIM